MRIIAGRFRSRPIIPPPSDITRPTSDRARESIFNVLTHFPGISLEGATIADVFAGSGALGLEALSRGAAHATFFENSTQAIQALQANINTLGVSNQSTIIRTNALKPPISPQPMDLIIFDPPYEQYGAQEILKTYLDNGWINVNSLIIYEKSSKTPHDFSHPFVILDKKAYGAAAVFFLRYTNGGAND